MKTADISVEYIDHMGNDASVVRAARISHAGDTTEFDNIKDVKLIQYLAKHNHKSPFNHTFITVKVKVPIFVSRQLVKHKFMPWNEESRRYINSEPEFYIPSEYRLAAENVKQGSSELVHEDSEYSRRYVYHSTTIALDAYNKMLAAGVCNEQARMVLPQNMMVNYYWSGTLGAMCDMLVLRLDKHTQLESRIVAQKILEIIKPLFPVSVEALLGENHE